MMVVEECTPLIKYELNKDLYQHFNCSFNPNCCFLAGLVAGNVWSFGHPLKGNIQKNSL